ncbi:uncharacterized protein LOC112042165 [Lingula anatina]|uniref:Uncharacterized protein LOC112042165 n=1 Tax=Lingula anatina TaxID=7574 RepID=A0A2R2MP19_LINAN|nr:uncharacterized protein LOC112042165 [Lingula anatina]|eukprot:XP_023931975.1 uncharacterized protein LOC112042165 [Lingula anatina]
MKQLAAQDKETFRNWLTATKSGEINQKDLSEFDVNEMYSMLVALATEKRATERYDGSDTDSDPSLKVELPLGSRVRRGPDWAGQSEDADGPGTVVEHQKGRKVLVKWDYTDGIGVYRFGENNCYDVLPTDEPRILRADQLIDVGVKVVRGPDWEWGDQDGGEGNVGTVYKVEQRGAVWVQWPNGSYNMYRYGHEGLIDLTIVDVVSSDNNVQPKTLANDGGMPNTSQENGHAWWQWNRNGSWVLYPVNVNMRLEQEYQANPRSGVEVEIDSVRRYVDFQNLKDLCMDTGEEFEIQRSVFTEDEYVAALSTT